MLVMAGVRCTAIPLLFGGQMHICNLHLPGKIWHVSSFAVGARMAFKGSVESARVAVEPVVVSLHGVLWGLLRRPELLLRPPLLLLLRPLPRPPVWLYEVC